MAETAQKPDLAGDGLPAPFASSDATLADLAPDSVVQLDLTGEIQYWNPASEKLYGLPAIGAVGRNIQDLSVYTTGSAVEQWNTLLQQGSWEGIVRRCTPWGEHVAVTVRQTVRSDKEGRPFDVVEYGRPAAEQIDQALEPEPDLSRLTSAGWELDISAVRPLLDSLASLVDRGSTGERVLREDRAEEILEGILITDVNDRAVELVGALAGRSGMLGQSLISFWPFAGRQMLAELIVALSAGSASNPIRMRSAVPDGILRNPIITVWRSAAPERRDTMFVAVNGAADDDRSFWHLRASEERYRRLIHFLPSALLQVDATAMRRIFAELKADGVDNLDAYLDDHPELINFANNNVRVIEANQEAVALFRTNALADFIRPVGFVFAASHETVRRVMVAAFEGKRNYVEVMKLGTFDGRLLDVRLSVTYPAPPERMDVTLLYLEDITERLHTQRQLRQLEVDFARSARISMIGELATSIAHEVNQPLSAIVTNGETALRWLMRCDPNLSKVADLTTRIVSSARRASDIVQRIRGMAANHEPARVELNLNDVVEEALLFLRHDLETKSIALSATLATELPYVIGDRVQLQQVIVNLLVNSFQAIAQDGVMDRRIELSTSGDQATAKFSIHDSGPGIEAEYLDRIFESFFTTRQFGIGIGLAICQSIVNAHGGNLSATNHPDGGALFSFSLPAAII
jgi:PAS domain S-box-containing protein